MNQITTSNSLPTNLLSLIFRASSRNCFDQPNLADEIEAADKTWVQPSPPRRPGPHSHRR